MNTIAELKRKLATSVVTLRYGTGWNNKPHKYLNVPRKVSKMQSKNLMFEGGSWLDIPRTDEVYFLDDNTYAIHENGNVILVYEMEAK